MGATIHEEQALSQDVRRALGPVPTLTMGEVQAVRREHESIRLGSDQVDDVAPPQRRRLIDGAVRFVHARQEPSRCCLVVVRERDARKIRDRTHQEFRMGGAAAASTAWGSSSRRLKSATLRSHRLCAIAGNPLTTCSEPTSLITPPLPVTVTASPMVQYPATPTCPKSVTSFPTRVAPPRPTCGHTRVSSAMLDSCPTCARPPIFTSRPIRVSPMEARSTHAFACTSTLSPNTAAPGWASFTQVSCPSFVSLANPKPSAPMTAPFCRTTSSPRRQYSRTTACAWAKNWLPMRAPR